MFPSCSLIFPSDHGLISPGLVGEQIAFGQKEAGMYTIWTCKRCNSISFLSQHVYSHKEYHEQGRFSNLLTSLQAWQRPGRKGIQSGPRIGEKQRNQLKSLSDGLDSHRWSI